MSYTIQTTNFFDKELKIIKKSNPKISKKTIDIIKRLMKGPPFEAIFNVHKLIGHYTGNYSINISGDRRIVFSIDLNNKSIILRYIGTHSQLYNK